MNIRSKINNASCFALVLILSFIFLATTAFAETKTFIKEYTYQASEYDSKATARILALEQVKRLLLEELGTYLESETEVKNFQLSQDRIVAYTAGIVKSEIINEKWDGKSYYLTAKMQADPQEIYKILNEMLSDRKKRNELEKAKIQTEELLREVEILKKELAGTESKKVSVVIQNQKKYQILVNSISAVDWYNVGKAYASQYSYPITYDPQYAIIAFNRAIEMNPRLAEAYYERGNMYVRPSEYSYPLTFDNKTKAIEDFNMAIHLDPKLSEAWLALIQIYSSLRDFDQALNYFAKAIEVNANDKSLYVSRALLNLRLRKDFQQSIKDFTKAIELETDNKYSDYLYFGRGDAYKKIGDYQNALKDYNKGIDLLINAPDRKFDINLHNDEFFNRALINVALGNYQQAIRNYDEILKLYAEKKEKELAKKIPFKEDSLPIAPVGEDLIQVRTPAVPAVFAKLYYYRGMLYDKLGNAVLASKDFDSAFQLSSGGVVFIEAEDLLKEEKYIESIQAANRGIELALPRLPDESESKSIKLMGHGFRSFVYKQLKNYQLALSEIESAYQQAPNMDVKRAVLRLKAMIYWDIGKSDDSIKCIDEAIRIDPSEPSLFKIRGIYFLLMKKYSLALADFENVIKIDHQKGRSNTLRDLNSFLPDEKNDWQRAYPMEQEREIYNNFQILAEKYPKFKRMYDKYLTDYWEKDHLPDKDALSKTKEAENEWIKIALVMLANENYDGAEKAFTKAAGQEPKNANIYIIWGDSYFKIIKYQDAIKAYGKAIALQPNEMSFYIKHAEASYHLDDYKKVVTDLDIIVKKYHNAQTLLCRGLAYELLGKYDLAFADYNKSLQKEKSAAALLRRGNVHLERGNYNQAIQDINQAIAFYLESSANKKAAPNLSEDEQPFVKNPKPDKLSEFLVALKSSLLSPGFSEVAAYNMRGNVYSKLGNYRRAIEDYNEAIRLKPNYATAYKNRGNAYNDLGQHQRAIADYSESIRLLPNYAPLYVNRGLAYYDLNQYQRAIEDYNEAIRLKPDYVRAYHNRGVTYGNLGQHQRALEDFNVTIRLKPDHADAYSSRGNAYSNLGQHQRAIQDHNEAIRLAPDDASAYHNRAVTYLLQGNKNLGCRDAQKACALGVCKALEAAKSNGSCR